MWGIEVAGDPEGKIFLRVKVGAYFHTPPPEWVDAVDERLRRIVSHMLSHPAYREHIAAIHLENCEWFEYGFRESGSDSSSLVYCATEAGKKTVRLPDGTELRWNAYMGETRYFEQ